MKTVRCAIYTRKSSDEGLEQDFNSLHAQRDACAAYILSQAGEGWEALPDHYDDGGISGGTLERPALQRLMADVAVGKIDVIVVYKVDRLTRSLIDFSKLVERFEQAGTSFISITQAFNTTTSTGRLMLNMLLSFAQFEREVTAERIRDKITASKAKGMWMGGIPPLGYKPDGRSLAIVEEHAVLTRRIFERYLALGNVRLLAGELEREGTQAPKRTLASGREIGGVPFTRGQLYGMLNNPLYIGEVHHQQKVHKGLHQPLIDRATWDRAQARLTGNTQGERRGRRSASAALLADKIVEEAGEPLIAVHSSRSRADRTIRYGYYVSRGLHHGETKQGLRVPTREADALVIERLAAMCEDPLQLMADARLDVPAGEMKAFSERVATLAGLVRDKDQDRIRTIVAKVQVLPASVEIRCDVNALAAELGVTVEGTGAGELLLSSEVRLTRSGMAMRMIGEGRAAPKLDVALVRLLAQARGYWTELKRGEIDITRLAAREGVSASWLTRMVRLAFLSPTLVEGALSGKQSKRMTALSIVQPDAVATSWKMQLTTFAG